MKLVDKNSIQDLIKKGLKYRKNGYSYGRFPNKPDLIGLVSPNMRPATPIPGHITCMRKEGAQPFKIDTHLIFVGDDLSKPETLEFWAVEISYVEACKEKTGRTVNFDGFEWEEYRNKNIVIAVHMDVPFKLVDTNGQEFEGEPDYWVIYDLTPGKENWWPCAPEKFFYAPV